MILMGRCNVIFILPGNTTLSKILITLFSPNDKLCTICHCTIAKRQDFKILKDELNLPLRNTASINMEAYKNKTGTPMCTYQLNSD